MLLLPLIACSPTPLAVGDGDVWDLPEGHEPIPFGFWGLNGYQDEDGLQELQDRFGLTAFHTSTRHPNYAQVNLLPLVQDAGLSVNLRLVGDHSYYTDEHGNFDLKAWQAMLEPWREADLSPFIEDGTLAFHMLLDDIDTFEGADPTAEDLEAMARTSKEVLPGLATLVRQEATQIPPLDEGPFTHLDASVNQYRADYGDVTIYAEAQVRAAQELGIGLVNGLNIADGGDGSSGQPGWSEGKWAMSAAEIERYGYVLLGTEDCRMFLSWEYDGEEAWSDGTIGADYFDEPELAASLAWLGAHAAGELD
jgi:hypothetical protein